MPIAYQVPQGATPNEPYQELYLKQVDGTYLLDVTGLPDQPADHSEASPQTSPEISPQTGPETGPEISPETAADPAPAAAPDDTPSTGFGAGSQTDTHPTSLSYLISPTDSEGIARSLAALASGAASLSTT